MQSLGGVVLAGILLGACGGSLAERTTTFTPLSTRPSEVVVLTPKFLCDDCIPELHQADSFENRASRAAGALLRFYLSGYAPPGCPVLKDSALIEFGLEVVDPLGGCDHAKCKTTKGVTVVKGNQPRTQAQRITIEEGGSVKIGEHRGPLLLCYLTYGGQEREGLLGILEMSGELAFVPVPGISGASRTP